MNLLPFDEKGLHMRFDTFCKKVLKYRNYKFLREEYRRRERYCVFSDLNADKLDQFYISDKYEALNFGIDINDITVSIENELLYNALLQLPEKRLEIILLSFFMDLTDREIGEKMSMPQSTVRYNRIAAMKCIKDIMEMGG